jgi:hypothetical protein
MGKGEGGVYSSAARLKTGAKSHMRRYSLHVPECYILGWQFVKALYIVLSLVRIATKKGTPVRIRDCPAAVKWKRKSSRALALWGWEATTGRLGFEPLSTSPKTCQRNVELIVN